MIGKKLKGNVMEIQFQDRVDEVETYTLIELSREEAWSLILLAEALPKQESNLQMTASGATFKFKYKDAIDDYWNSLVVYKVVHFPKNLFSTVSSTYTCPLSDSKLSGYLIRDQRNHTIRYFNKNPNKPVSYCNVNILGITPAIHDLFIKESETGCYFKKNNSHELHYDVDKDIYLVWSTYMNERYIELARKK